MPLRKNVIRGITEVGAVRAGNDVSFGKTAPDGATIAFQPNQLEVESGQSTFLEDLFVTSNRVEVTFRLIFANLVNIQEVLGLPASALTGSLESPDGGVTPATAEVITIPADGIGAREDHLYMITPGPAGTRRYDLYRCKVKGNLTIDASRDRHFVVEGTWAVLRAEVDGAGAAVTGPMRIEDSL